jgi:flagellar basal-body rod modification protein FlgD
MTVTTTSPTATTAAAYGDALVRTPKKTSLGSDDFMKLLAVQFQSQDPMKPMEDTAFIAQMAQFSALDQSNSLVREMALLRSDQQNLTASGMLGRNVTVEGLQGVPVTGQVTAIENSADGPVLLIDGARYPLSSVQRVEYTPPVYQQPAADHPPAA